jgi:hypothetical protein
MRKKILAGLAAVSLTLSMAGTADAKQHPRGAENPRHPHHHEDVHGHGKILGFEEADGMVRYSKCIDLPGHVPLHSHHVHKHMGGAHGPNQLVFPTAPYGFFEDCAHLAALLGPPGVWFPDPDA